MGRLDHHIPDVKKNNDQVIKINSICYLKS